MLRNSNRTRLSPLVEICQLAEVLEHAITKVLQAADDHGRSRHRIHFRSIKRAVVSGDSWDSARRGPRARSTSVMFRSHGEQAECKVLELLKACCRRTRSFLKRRSKRIGIQSRFCPFALKRM